MSTETERLTMDPRRRRRQDRARGIADQAGGSLRGMIVKLIAVGIVDAIALYAVLVLATFGEWGVLAIVVAVAILINWIYFSRRALPAKYLAPGVFFLAVFQVFVLLYTGYVGFTNYGTGHNGSKDQAVNALMASALERVPDSPTYPVTVVEEGGELGLLVTSPAGNALLGTQEDPLAAVDATFDGDRAVAVEGWTSLQFADVLERQAEVTELSVAFSDDPNDGRISTPDGSSAYRYTSTLEYDGEAITDTATGTVYEDVGTGAFTAADGEELMPGWKVAVGFDNFVRAVSDSRLAGPLIYVTLWTFAFAAITVAATFVIGLFLAITFNHKRHARPPGLPIAADPAVRDPLVPLGARVGRNDERELRIPQPGDLRRRRHPLAHGSMDGEAVGAHREHLARLPIHVPRVHGRSAVDPR